MFFVPATEASIWGANFRGGPIFSTTSDCGTDHDLLRGDAEMVRWELRSLRPGSSCDHREIRNP